MRLPLPSRGVTWTGLGLGTFITVWVMSHHMRLEIGAVPAIFRGLAGFAAIWLLAVVGTGTLAWLAIRYRRAAFAAVRRQSGQAVRGDASRTAQRAAPGLSRPTLGQRLITWSQGRRPPTAGAAAAWQDAGDAIEQNRPGQAAAGPSGPAGSGWPAPPASSPVSPAGGSPAGGSPQPAPSSTAKGGRTVMTASPAGPRNGRGPARREHWSTRAGDGTVPQGWGVVSARAHDFEPLRDEELLEFLAGEFLGGDRYAQSLRALHERLVRGTRLDPESLRALERAAEAFTMAASILDKAGAEFVQHHELPNAFVANGGVLPKDGDFLTGNV